MIIMKKVKKMIKSLLKIFLPSSKKLADMAAEKIYEAVNCSNKEEQIANMAKYIDPLSTLTTKLVNLLKDGKLDEAEKKEISEALEPFIDKLLKML